MGGLLPKITTGTITRKEFQVEALAIQNLQK